MSDNDNNRTDDTSKLRERAEKILVSKSMPTELTVKDQMALIHELQVHQIELQIQNEELRNSQEIIENSRKKYVDLYDFAPVGYFTVDMSRVIIEANLTISELLGYPRSYLIGKPLTAFIYKDDLDILFIHQRKLSLKGTVERCELRLVKKDRSSFYSQMVSTSFAERSQEVSNLLIAVIDISARKQLEDELADQTRELSFANKELESFTYSASHDLSGPLHITRGLCSILLEDYSDVLDDTGKKFLKAINQNTDKMKALIDDLMRLSKISRKELSLQEVNLSVLAAEIIRDLRSTHPQRVVDVTIQDNLKTFADEKLIQIALTNLFSNAWKYTEKTEQSRIEFGAFKREKDLVFFIRDNGAGFDMAFAHKLFVPFQRLHSESAFSGTGIGLAIVARIISRHKGLIWAEAKTDKGATFYFTLG
jgi:PAS domain S-box-containing protein